VCIDQNVKNLLIFKFMEMLEARLCNPLISAHPILIQHTILAPEIIGIFVDLSILRR
jgi:hypothetical protein